jgi:predicted transcriptional regulator
MAEKRTVVITVRLPESIGEAVKRLADQDRRKPSSYLALVIEDAIKAKLAAEPSGAVKPATKGRKG